MMMASKYLREAFHFEQKAFSKQKNKKAGHLRLKSNFSAFSFVKSCHILFSDDSDKKEIDST